MSALYGSNAMGGVINIISRKPAQKPVSFEARGMYGTYNTWDAGATLSGLKNKLDYYLSFGHLDSDGYNPVPEDQHTEYDVKLYLEENHFKGRVSYEFSNQSKMTMGYLFFDENRGGEGKRPAMRMGCIASGRRMPETSIMNGPRDPLIG